MEENGSKWVETLRTPRIMTLGLLFLVSFASLMILRLLRTFLRKELLLLWLGDDVERLWNELSRLGTSMK
ncbi:hypothetical protein Tco_0067659, partial [Tanacetum coccineum]